MAKNLIATPWQERVSKPGFGYAGGFQDILTAYNGLAHRGANARYHDNQDLLQEQITHLEELKSLLEQDEDEFFSLFDIYSKDKKECFWRLQEKIDEWDRTGAYVLINNAEKQNKFYEALTIFQRHAIATEITEENWNEMLTLAFQEEGGETVSGWLEDGLNIAQMFNQMLQSENKSKPFATGHNSSLIDNIQVTIDENGEIIVTSDKSKISPTLRRKIMAHLEKHLGTKKPKGNNYDFKLMFEELFRDMPIDSVGQRYILQALGEYAHVLKNYAFNSSQSQIKGFLGEIYNNAFLYFMASGSKHKKQAIESISPTGTALNEKGQQLVIDTWLKGYGIQVKNYEQNKVQREGFTFSKSYDAYSFITDVLQLGSVGPDNYASVGDILLNFFTAFDYNRDYGDIDPSVKNKDSYKFWVSARARMNDRVKDVKSFTTIMMPYVDKVVGIDRRFSTPDNNMFIEPKEYRNTFFNISGKYIPSSVLVQALIDTIMKKRDSLFTDMVRAEFKVTSYKKSIEEKWNPSVTDKDVANIFANREKYAATSKIGYTVTFNVSEITRYLLDGI